MTSRTKYSVIIPVYNAESTIERCISSLLHEIPETAELLIVNDGSWDDSDRICKDYCNRYECIRYHTKLNGGVSTARNLGLDEARGEYVLFVDSDDYVSEAYWRTITALLNEHRPDMLQFGFVEHGIRRTLRGNGKYHVCNQSRVAQKATNEMREYRFSSLLNRVFLRALIERHHIRFEEGIHIGEDQLFIFEYIIHAKSLRSINDCLYNVVLDNQESLSRKKRAYLMEQLINVSMRMQEALNKASMPAKTRSSYQTAVAWVFYRSAYSCCKELLKFNLTAQERDKRIREICQNYKKQGVWPRDVRCLIIAIPILISLSRPIDWMIRRSEG